MADAAVANEVPHVLPDLHEEVGVPEMGAANDAPEATGTSRPRVPQVGNRLTESGEPSFFGWASCLTLGDLEAALRKAVA